MKKTLPDQLDKIHERLTSIDKTLVRQEGHLAEHIRRTALLEDEIKPIKKHVGHVEGAIKLIGLLSIIAGLLKAFNVI